MTFHELVKKVQTALVKADASKVEEHIAVQVNVTGEAEGAFYIEIKEGVLYVEGYDYNDRDALLTGDGEEILAVVQGKLPLKDAVGEEKLYLEGNYEKILVLGSIIPAKKTRKTAEKKEETPAEKPKKTRKAAEKTEDTTPAEKTKKAKKTEAKTEEAAPAEKPKRGRKAAEKPAEAVEAPVAETPIVEAAPVVEEAAEAVAPVEPEAPAKKKTSRKPASKKTEETTAKPKRGRKSSKK